ncbi:hypothetical protein FA95DRAFT_1609108 [Auriscalpium vulgare]|uniref:Uncharacterized protein n=1 Tax=Auriscalpium vulgare TaxID=40419 RepID=A0ACB8RHW8_9AGAM|nr:hypothetical protein FA95DRAFT_1609108 [Auriscalpium vulgare]
MDSSLARAAIAAFALEAIVYGFSAFMYSATLWVLLRPATVKNRSMAIVSLILFACSTAHVVLDAYRLKLGFIDNQTFLGIGPSAWFGDGSQCTFLVKNCVYILQTLTGDAIVIFRCYVVWQSAWVIVFPCIMWFGLAVCGIMSVYAAANTNPLGQNKFADAETAYFALTISTNLLSTSLLVYRIWKSNLQVRKHRVGPSRLVPLMTAIVDAAVLYSAVLLTGLVCFLCKLIPQYITLLDLTTQIIPITFYIVIIRVRLQQLPSALFCHQACSQWAAQSPSHGLPHLRIQIDQAIDRHSEGGSLDEAVLDIKQPSFSGSAVPVSFLSRPMSV